MTAVQLTLDWPDCEPTWTTDEPPKKPARRRRPRSFEKYDLRGQGLTPRQLDRITTIRLTGSYL